MRQPIAGTYYGALGPCLCGNGYHTETPCPATILDAIEKAKADAYRQGAEDTRERAAQRIRHAAFDGECKLHRHVKGTEELADAIRALPIEGGSSSELPGGEECTRKARKSEDDPPAPRRW